MNEQTPTAAATSTASGTAVNEAHDQKRVIAAYTLMMAAPLLWFTPLVAVVLAYVQRGNSGDLARSHYGNVIRCFWITLIGIVMLVVYVLLIMPGLAMLSTVGFDVTTMVNLALLAHALTFTIWIYIRLIKGLNYLLKGKPCA